MEVIVSDVSLGEGHVRVLVGDPAWCGEWRASTLARLGRADVEVDLMSDLRWTADALTGAPAGENVVVGPVEDADAAGTVTLRVGGGIVLVDVPEDGPLPRAGDIFRLERVALAFTPTGI